MGVGIVSVTRVGGKRGSGTDVVTFTTGGGGGGGVGTGGGGGGGTTNTGCEVEGGRVVWCEMALGVGIVVFDVVSWVVAVEVEVEVCAKFAVCNNSGCENTRWRWTWKWCLRLMLNECSVVVVIGRSVVVASTWGMWCLTTLQLSSKVRQRWAGLETVWVKPQVVLGMVIVLIDVLLNILCVDAFHCKFQHAQAAIKQCTQPNGSFGSLLVPTCSSRTQAQD